MNNQAMQRHLQNGEAIDVSKFERTSEGWYKFPEGVAFENLDLCVADTEEWIWSVGKNLATGGVFASVRGDTFYPARDGWECVWLR